MRYLAKWLFVLGMMGGLCLGYAEDKNYADSVTGFSLQHPDDFQVKGTVKAPMIIADLTHRSGKYGVQIRKYKKTVSFEKFVLWYVDNFLWDMKGARLVEESHQTIGSHDGYVAVFDAQKRNGYTLKSWLIEGSRHFIAFQGGFPSQQKDQFEQILNSIVASFQWSTQK